MRYFAICRKQKWTDEMYRIYVTDGLYALTNPGQRLVRQYIDIVKPDHKIVEEERTPEEIISSIRSKLERMAAE